MIALTAARLYTPTESLNDAVVLVEDRWITAVHSRREFAIPGNCRHVDFGQSTIAPAFIDIHIHGNAGHDVMESGTTALPAVERSLAKHGVGSYFPTTVTAPTDQILAALDRLANAIENTSGSTSGEQRATPIGIHLEGPFLSHARRGVHPIDLLQTPTVALFEKFWQAARGHIKLMTIAPELKGAEQTITEAVRRGVCVSLGHSDADQDTARSAVQAGARHATHTFNAMRALGHRDPGLLGVVLTDSRLSADIIADGVHLDPTIVRLFLDAKGADLSVLITDATAATGMPDGRYRLGSFEVEVEGDRCMADGKLAGSVLTMDRAVQNLMQFAGWNLRASVQAATLNPARVVGMHATGTAQRGVIAVGAVADIVLLSESGEVQATILGGQVAR